MRFNFIFINSSSILYVSVAGPRAPLSSRQNLMFVCIVSKQKKMQHTHRAAKDELIELELPFD
jgi:hypothetical protein